MFIGARLSAETGRGESMKRAVTVETEVRSFEITRVSGFTVSIKSKPYFIFSPSSTLLLAPVV